MQVIAPPTETLKNTCKLYSTDKGEMEAVIEVTEVTGKYIHWWSLYQLSVFDVCVL